MQDDPFITFHDLTYLNSMIVPEQVFVSPFYAKMYNIKIDGNKPIYNLFMHC
jgi:hypothetical protein